MSSNSEGCEDAEDDPDDKPAPGGTLPDAALVAYAQNRDKLWRTAAVALRPHGLESYAKDVVQNALMSLSKNPPTDIDSWSAVLVTAVKYRAIDFSRQKASLHERPVELRFDGYEEPRPVNIDSAMVETTVIEADERERLVARVRKAVGELPGDQREVIERVFYKEESQVHAAHALSVTPSRVSQLKSAAFKQLIAKLQVKEVNS